VCEREKNEKEREGGDEIGNEKAKASQIKRKRTNEEEKKN
jgi:hypothetical protein